ncbi:MAG: arsenate reductase ArsC [Fimbriimonadales bacterium]|nr:arsenate reductase ArsC [Fimbriimonadales bacterium]
MESRPKLVLFVCVGNSCRSQMAEGFGNHYGQGKVVAFSAGTAPSGKVHPLAIQAMHEVGIDISRQTSKGVWEFDIAQFDAVVSLCDARTDELCPAGYMGIQEHWNIPDPIGLPMDEFRRVRAMIETRVQALIRRLSDDV